MTRIDERFAKLRAEKRKAFIPYVTAGDPSLDITEQLIYALDAAGADVIELGVPFSDPIADGPVIQRATERALQNNVSLRDVLGLVAKVRKQTQVPLLLMSYYNPLLRFGLKELAEAARRAGVDGVLATDLTVEESGPFRETMQAVGLNTVFLAAPTSSPERMKKIAAASTGFLYAVSRTGITGEQQQLSTELQGFLDTLRKNTNCPVAVGFGISSPEHVKAVWTTADGAVVGSAIVREIEKNIGQNDLVKSVAAFATWLKGDAA